MENRQPLSRASSSSRVGGSRRSGRELISTATSCSAHAANTALASNSLLGRTPRLPVTSRPVQWPSTLVNGLRIAPIMRRVIASASIRSLEWTLATRTSSRASISSVWSREPSSRMSTSMPLSRVKLPPRWVVDRVDHAELPGQPLGAQPVGDPQPRRVVGQHQVVVAELDRGEGHLLDRRPAVGPVGVGVQVAPQQRRAARGRRPPAGRRAAASSRASRSGTTPRTASAITPPVLAPMPGSSVRVPASTRAATSPSGSGRIAAAAARNASIRRDSSRPRSIRKAIRRSAATGPCVVGLAHTAPSPIRRRVSSVHSPWTPLWLVSAAAASAGRRRPQAPPPPLHWRSRLVHRFVHKRCPQAGDPGRHQPLTAGARGLLA